MCKYAAVWQCPAHAHQMCGPRPQASQYAAALQCFSAYLVRFAPMRMHGLSRTFAGVPRSKRLFLKECVIICSNTIWQCPAPKHRNMLRHSSAYLVRFTPTRMHGLSRTFAGVPRSKRPFLKECMQICSRMAVSCPCSPDLRPQAPSIAICSSPAAF